MNNQSRAIEKLKQDQKIIGETLDETILERDKLLEENKQLRSLLKDAEDEIKRLEESNKGLMESLVNKESEDEDDIYVPSKSSMRFL